jgi:probable phosphoglycerate mutase
MHCGAWEGLDVAERERRYPEEMKLWKQDPWRTAIPGAESLEQVHLRAGRVLQRVLREHAGQSVMLSGHGFFNRVTLLSLLGLPRNAFWDLKQPNASCHVLRWEGTLPRPDPVTLVSPLPHRGELLVGQPADA